MSNYILINSINNYFMRSSKIMKKYYYELVEIEIIKRSIYRYYISLKNNNDAIPQKRN